MEDATFFRFEKSVIASSILKGETSDYAIKGVDAATLYSCRAVGNCITEPTVFRDTEGAAVATLKAHRRLMNRAYDLCQGEEGPQFAAIHTWLGSSWTVEVPAAEARFRILDSEQTAKAIARDALGGSPDVYLVLQGEAPIGRVERTARPPAAHVEAQGGPLGFLRRKVASVLKNFDWTLLLDNALDPQSTQALIAATVLLHEHTIRHARSASAD